MRAANKMQKYEKISEKVITFKFGPKFFFKENVDSDGDVVRGLPYRILHVSELLSRFAI